MKRSPRAMRADVPSGVSLIRKPVAFSIALTALTMAARTLARCLSLIGPIAIVAIVFAIVFATPGISVEKDYIDKLTGPGDYKDGYRSGDYKTQSRSVQSRVGKVADLYAIYKNPQIGLPPPSAPEYNLQTSEAIALGRRLFYDRRLSLNNTMSCAICHVPEMGFTNNELKTAIGFEGRSGRRNAPTLLNVAYRTRLFHDGREQSLENQVWSPLLARNEMANTSIGQVLEKIKRLDDYDKIFRKVFKRGVTMETVGMALAQYQRTLISANSRFDRWHYGGEKNALNAEEKFGFEVFSGKGRCTTCHLVGAQSALFTDNLWHNTGIGYRQSMGLDEQAPTENVQLAPGYFVDVERRLVDEATVQKPQNDIGLYESTQDPADRWKYITPTLRNVELTAPYMHNGSLLTLEAVVEFYNKGGEPNEVLDPLMVPLSLSAKEKRALVAFLKTLTGSNINVLVSDAFAAAPPDSTAAE